MAAAEQLCLDLGADTYCPSCEIDLADAMIAACGGNARQPVLDLMLEADFLRDQLATAAALMSSGYRHGLRPKYESLHEPASR